MSTKAVFLRNITFATLLGSTVIFFGCQKHDDLSEQDAAMANADRSAQAAQSATDAATAAIPESAVRATAAGTVAAASEPKATS